MSQPVARSVLTRNELLSHLLPMNHSAALEETFVRCIQLSLRLRIPVPETVLFDPIAYLEEVVADDHACRVDGYAGDDCEGFVSGAEVLGLSL